MTNNGDLSTFKDGHLTSSWAVEAMRWGVANGLLSGKDGNRLDASGVAMRSEIAQVMTNFVNFLMK